MEQMYRRLAKYALDPDNKTEYAGRADQNGSGHKSE